MNFNSPRNTVRTGPEAHGAKRLRIKMTAIGWHLEKLHGNKYQSGLPDYVAMHIRFGLVWIETKAPGGKLSQRQHQKFAVLEEKGQKIFVLENETHYGRLFTTPNWRQYIRW